MEYFRSRQTANEDVFGETPALLFTSARFAHDSAFASATLAERTKTVQRMVSRIFLSRSA
jgi:hypothetical protein